MEILVDVGGFTDDYANDIENALFVISSDFDLSFPQTYFKIEEVQLEETIDAWEHIRALRLYEFRDEEAYYNAMNLLNVIDVCYQES